MTRPSLYVINYSRTNVIRVAWFFAYLIFFEHRFLFGTGELNVIQI